MTGAACVSPPPGSSPLAFRYPLAFQRSHPPSSDAIGAETIDHSIRADL
ncbi:hypothetical protein [Streptomyces chartreusis]|uniref:Uncharacterized protein n=1 Tax=Streptomyces chartreusis TaxID=1969 RepID=A0A7H8T6E6_STRCX|nr:hypothetical protein [Streptomyces chartreusis]QKZ19099.1 hypothetical protein HUT05_18015 [Streptomyces chartreusis]